MVRVVATGVFDLIHLGHVHFLEEAKKLGDELVVIVATDATVRKHKHVPITPQEMRVKLVSALKPVDRAVLGHEGDPYEIIEELKPDIIVIGYDQPYEPERLSADLRERGLDVKVVRLGHYDADLNGTRKIIKRIEKRLAKNELYGGKTDEEDRDC